MEGGVSRRARVVCVCKGRRPLGGPGVEVTAPPYESGGRHWRGRPERHQLTAPPPRALPSWAAWHSPAQGIVFPACSRQRSASKNPSQARRGEQASTCAL